MCKFDPDYVSEVMWPYHWEMLVASLDSDYQGSPCLLFESKSEDWAKHVRV